jgi:phenylacetate-CoA ligase
MFKYFPQSLSFFLSRIPAGKIEKRGTQFALQTFQETISRVPAYRKFLKTQKVNPHSIKGIEDFKILPHTNKANYLQKFSIQELCLDGSLADKYLIDSSSGYGGKRSYWPRLPREDEGYPRYMEMAYRQFFYIDKTPTLMIITLVLGSWIGGEKISWATRQIAIQGKNRLTVITPGAKLDEIIDIVKQFSHLYGQIVIVGYPPFMKLIIDEGAKKGIIWKDLNVKLGLGGEGYSEEWRENIRALIGIQDKDLMGISGGYGAADLGMSVGREYPISVLIRKLAHKDKRLACDLFGQWKPLPSFCQYNPSSIYIEEENGELIFTAQPGIPLIRYNIHDRGGVISYDEVLNIVRDHGYSPLEILADYGYQKRDIWRLPFFYVWGRSDGSVSLYGAFIYPESIKIALDNPEISKLTTGNFVMNTETDQDKNPYLHIKIELAPGIDPGKKSEGKFAAIITRSLIEQNPDYKELQSTLGDKVMIFVSLLKYRNPEIFDPEQLKQRYTIKK